MIMIYILTIIHSTSTFLHPGKLVESFRLTCETVKCNGEHYWTGYDLTYSNCKLELEWENGKQGPGTGSVGRSRAVKGWNWQGNTVNIVSKKPVERC
jgi:hypothetical protein